MHVGPLGLRASEHCNCPSCSASLTSSSPWYPSWHETTPTPVTLVSAAAMSSGWGSGWWGSAWSSSWSGSWSGWSHGGWSHGGWSHSGTGSQHCAGSSNSQNEGECTDRGKAILADLVRAITDACPPCKWHMTRSGCRKGMKCLCSHEGKNSRHLPYHSRFRARGAEDSITIRLLPKNTPPLLTLPHS